MYESVEIMEYYTLSREELKSIAARAAELAIEQMLDDRQPTIGRPSFRTSGANGDTVDDVRELTQSERNIVSSIFKS